MFRAELDAIDIRILKELQADGRMTNVELASRAGISAPPCLRRVRKLEEAGIIEGYTALLNAPALGYDLVAFCMVGLKHQSEANLKAFAAATGEWPMVRQAWMVSGDSDFLLHCVAETLRFCQRARTSRASPGVELTGARRSVAGVSGKWPMAASCESAARNRPIFACPPEGWKTCTGTPKAAASLTMLVESAVTTISSAHAR